MLRRPHRQLQLQLPIREEISGGLPTMLPLVRLDHFRRRPLCQNGKTSAMEEGDVAAIFPNKCDRSSLVRGCGTCTAVIVGQQGSFEA